MATLNLLPGTPQLRGFWGLGSKVARAVRTFVSRPPCTIGIAIEADAVHAVQVTRVTDQHQVVQVETVPLALSVVQDSDIRGHNELVARLTELRARFGHDAQQARTVLGVAGHDLIMKFVRMPWAADCTPTPDADALQEDVATQMMLEIEHHIPFGLEDVYVGWEFRGAEHSGSTPRVHEAWREREVRIAAIRRSYLDSYLAALAEAGFAVAAVEPLACALARIPRFTGNTAQEIAVVIQVGFDQSTIAIIENGYLSFDRTVGIGVQAIVEEIQKKTDCSWEEAEQWAFAPQSDQITAIISAVASVMAREYQRSLDFYLATTGDVSLEKVILTGRGALIPALREAIAQHAKVPVVVPAGEYGLPQTAPALGLALRADFTAQGVVPTPVPRVVQFPAKPLGKRFKPRREELILLLEMAAAHERHVHTVPAQSFGSLAASPGIRRAFRRVLQAIADDLQQQGNEQWPRAIATHLELPPLLRVIFEQLLGGVHAVNLVNRAAVLAECLHYLRFGTTDLNSPAVGSALIQRDAQVRQR